MSSKEILLYGNKLLKMTSKRIVIIDDEIIKLSKDLKDTLKGAKGIGLSAPQIGQLKRIIFINLKDGTEPILVINPKIVSKSGKEEKAEGCLSYPGYEGTVIRPKRVRVCGINLKGKKVEYITSWLLARAFCHEIDHLNGILYMDRSKKLYKLQSKND